MSSYLLRSIALAAFLASLAYAQRPLQCFANAGVPSIARAEGVAEEVSQVIINCTGGTPTAAGLPIPAINIEVFFNTNVASRLLDSAGNRSEALLLLDEPQPAEQVEAPAVPFAGAIPALGTGHYKGPGRPNVFGAQASQSSLRWSNIPFDPPGDSTSRVMRLVNMRANANQLGLGSSQLPSQISLSISLSGAVSITLTNWQLTVAYIQRGVTYSAPSPTFSQCAAGTQIYTVSFAEMFGSAFRHKQSPGDQNVPGGIYNTESMFYNSAFTGIGAGAGIAAQGTRLSLRFTNVPATVTISVPAAGTSTGGDTAALVAPGTDGSTTDAATGLVTLTGGSGAAVYEFTASNPGAIATLNLSVSVAYSVSPAPALGTTTIAGNFAPVATTFSVSRDGAPRFVESPTSASQITLDVCVLPVTLSLSRTSLNLAATSNASAGSPSQDSFLTMTGASNNWTAVSNSAWLAVTPASGKGSVRLTASIVASSLPAPGIYTGKITVNATGATNGPLVLTCTLTVKSATTAPFGLLETPPDNTSGISGSIAVTGWALDDIGVNKVTIWRDPVGPEPVHPNGYIYIGDALFVPGSRPDVEAKYPTSPHAYRAGWGYMLLTNPLPGKGNGTFKLHAIAVDEEGAQVKLGTRTISVDNLRAVKPFGALDTPFPGQVISGLFSNDGWALTPQPSSIPANGSTIWVSVDGVYVGNPLFGGARGDVASIFPGYANSNSSAGQYLLDSTKYSNAMHTIAWIVSDNAGHSDGIGSRFFNIQNGATAAADPAPQAERSLQLRAARLQRSASSTSNPAFRRGYHRDAPLTPIRQAGAGLLEPIQLDELDRLELHLPASQQWTAAQRAGGELRDLPIGSTFDPEGGILYWQLGPAFLGEFTLEFRAADGAALTVPVRVGVTAPTTLGQ